RTPTELATAHVDVVIAQDARHVQLAEQWLGGRRPGVDVPLVWLEHNAPQGPINEMRHPARDRRDVTVVHVTRTNAPVRDTGSTPTAVIEHGVGDPRQQWTRDDPAAAAGINEPL